MKKFMLIYIALYVIILILFLRYRRLNMIIDIPKIIPVFYVYLMVFFLILFLFLVLRLVFFKEKKLEIFEKLHYFFSLPFVTLHGVFYEQRNRFICKKLKLTINIFKFLIIWDNSKYFRSIFFIIFLHLPRFGFIIALFIDTFCFHKFYYVFFFSFYLLSPIILRAFVYCVSFHIDYLLSLAIILIETEISKTINQGEGEEPLVIKFYPKFYEFNKLYEKHKHNNALIFFFAIIIYIICFFLINDFIIK